MLATGPEIGIDAEMGNDDPLRRNPVELDQVSLRPLGDGENTLRTPRGAASFICEGIRPPGIPAHRGHGHR